MKNLKKIFFIIVVTIFCMSGSLMYASTNKGSAGSKNGVIRSDTNDVKNDTINNHRNPVQGIVDFLQRVTSRQSGSQSSQSQSSSSNPLDPDRPNIPNTRSSDRVAKITTASGKIWKTFTVIAQILAISAIIFAGVRYMYASSDTKADIKMQTVILILGAALVFAAVPFAKYVSSIVEDLF